MIKECIAIILATLSSFSLTDCSSTTESGEVGANRSQLMLLSSEQISSMSSESYKEVINDAAKKNQLNRNTQQVALVKNIAQKLIQQTPVFRKDALSWSWETNVITSPEINAWCMPGGKMAVYTGIIEKLQLTEGELAAIMGHEISHALREHGRERMSEQLIQQLGLGLLAETGIISRQSAQVAGIVSAIAISLPHGRGQETEADEMGLELMARAGYNPREAVSLWRKMGEAGGGKPPEILSTHPSDSKRMQNLESLIPKVLPLYERSKR